MGSYFIFDPIYDQASTYEGHWEDGLMNGKGHFVWPSGDSYKGEWIDGKRYGYGVFKNAKSN